jgi:hypothetical protein
MLKLAEVGEKNGRVILPILTIAFATDRPTAETVNTAPLILHVPIELEHVVVLLTINPTGGVTVSEVRLALKLESMAKGVVMVRVRFEL